MSEEENRTFHSEQRQRSLDTTNGMKCDVSYLRILLNAPLKEFQMPLSFLIIAHPVQYRLHPKPTNFCKILDTLLTLPRSGHRTHRYSVKEEICLDSAIRLSSQSMCSQIQIFFSKTLKLESTF
jgi:hypothetical protein